MPIDPMAKAILDARAAMGSRPYRSMTVEAVRAQQRQQSAALNRKVVPVASVSDRAIPGPAGGLRVRIYAPEGAGPAPVVVFFHGGGFVIGDLETHDNLARSLCVATGSVLVSVDYRLAPEQPFPAAVDDALAATRWAFDNARSIGGDPSRVVLAGDSAGGSLAATTCLLLRDESGPTPRGQVLLYPITTWRADSTPSHRLFAEGYGLDREQMDWFAERYLPDPAVADLPLASPLLSPDLAGLPPALILIAEYDLLRDEAEQYAARLREAGVPTVLTRYDGMIHGFARFIGFVDGARLAIDDVAAWLRAL